MTKNLNHMTLNEIHGVWIELEKRLHGKLSFKEYLKANMLSNIITAIIEYKFNGYNIKLHQGLFEGDKGYVSFDPFEITAEIETESNFKLNIWRIDFFDKLLKRNRTRTGYREFDKEVGISGSNENDLIDFFRNDKIRNTLINDQMLNLQIENKEGKIIIKLKAFMSSKKIENVESQIKFFELIIKQLENIRIISAPDYK